jgi:Flp pilus assembly protein TadG
MNEPFGRERGQGLVEMALVLPIFLLVLFGIFDVGRAVYVNSTLSQAAREGARLAAVQAGWVGRDTDDDPACNQTTPGARVCPATLGALKANVVDAVNRMTVSVGPLSGVYFSCNEGTIADPAPAGDWTEVSGGNGCDDGVGASLGATGELVSVRVEHTYQAITPIVGSLLGTLTLSGSASMEIN